MNKKTRNIKNKLLVSGLVLLILIIGALSQTNGFSQSQNTTSDYTVLEFFTLFGGTGEDKIFSSAVDSMNNIYIAGHTSSSNFPVTAGAYKTERSSMLRDVFLAKLSPDGSEILFATYLFGTTGDTFTGTQAQLALDSNDNPILVAASDDPNFQTTTDAINQSANGNFDIIVLKLASNGSTLLYGSYLGGSSDEYAFVLSVDEEDNIYILGDTLSSNFPTTPGAYERTFSGAADIFITKILADGSAIDYSTLYGGSSGDSVPGMAIDSENNVWFAGSTASTNLPVTPDALNFSTNGGSSFIAHGVPIGEDLFIGKLASNGSTLLYSSYFGGSGTEIVEYAAVDSNDNFVFIGRTGSANFPLTDNAYDSTLSGINSLEDTFITKIAGNGSAVLYSSFLGGNGIDASQFVALDGEDNIYITGNTGANDFPLSSDAVDSTKESLTGQDREAFLTKLSANGSTLEYSTYLGGSNVEEIWSLALGQDDSIYVAGMTRSLDFPFSVTTISDISTAGIYNAFVAKFGTSDIFPTSNPTTIGSTTTTIDQTTTTESTRGFALMTLILVIVSLISLRKRKN
ncbi:MAG: SBBP repeat-containing protein [Candidatus Hodarchaeales archaeon]